MTQFFNHSKLQEYRRSLREHSTVSERKLWFYLRKRQIVGLRFLRQFSIGPYILDFYCPDKKLAIELDGGQHSQKKIIEYDLERDAFLRNYNIKILRFWNSDVMNNTNGVLENILQECSNPS